MDNIFSRLTVLLLAAVFIVVPTAAPSIVFAQAGSLQEVTDPFASPEASAGNDEAQIQGSFLGVSPDDDLVQPDFPTVADPSGTVDCFDHYSFNSVDISLQPSINTPAAGA
ncbi:MAG: hypothetical protein WEC84_03460 [Candidatus Andersenbacteria bacterium]